jgi:hypothetical protein
MGEDGEGFAVTAALARLWLPCRPVHQPAVKADNPNAAAQ